MAIITSASSFILDSTLTCLSCQRKPPATILGFASKLSFSKDRKLKRLASEKNKQLKTQNPICRYGHSSNTFNNDEKNNKQTKSWAHTVHELDSYRKRIWWSNVEVKRPKNVFVGRKKWNSSDIVNMTGALILHAFALFAPFTFNWGAFWVAAVLYVVTGMLGITLSYHRNLSHRSFKLPKWLEYFFAYCGVLALQRDPIFWVSTHRYHHQFVDSEQDPHSPLEGFWFSQINWLFDTQAILEKCGEPSNVGDLEKQPFYRFIQRTYFLHPLLLGLILYAIGGFPYVVWGMGVRSIWLYHITGLVNSVCHIWGKQDWKTGDLSKNNWWVALLSFGEGWHNNHHAFEYSARHGLEWWQIDMTWYTVKLLQFLGLAKEVKTPKEAHKQLLSFEKE